MVLSPEIMLEVKGNGERGTGNSNVNVTEIGRIGALVRVEWHLLKRRMGKAKRAHQRACDGHGHSPLLILLTGF